jgi:tetratricopeptide (TPR) repeat protein
MSPYRPVAPGIAIPDNSKRVAASFRGRAMCRFAALALVVLLSLVSLPARAQKEEWVGQWVFPKTNGVPLKSKDGKELLKWSVTAGKVVAADGERITIRHDQYSGPYEASARKDEVVKLADAPAFFGEQIRANEKAVWPRVMRAAAWSLQRKHDSAVKELTEVIRLHPSAALHDFRGGALLLGGEIDAAIADFDKAIQLDPNRASTFSNRGLARSLKGDLAQATRDYSESIRLNPDYSRAFHNRGLTWSARGEPDKAIQDYTEAIRLNPDFREAVHDRALAWLARKNYDKAIQDFDRTLELDPNDARALMGRADAWNLKTDYDRAIRDYSAVLQLDPKNVAALQDRGAAYRAKGEYVKAAGDYDEAIRLEPKNTGLYRRRAELWWARGQPSKSIADLSTVIRLEPGEATHYYARGFVWNHLRNYAKAIDDYTAANRIKPDDPGALNALAWVLATCPEEKYRDGKRAVELATRACEMTRWKDPNHLGTLAAASAEAGDFEKAVEYQKQALEDPEYEKTSSAEAHFRLRLYRDRRPYREPPAKK